MNERVKNLLAVIGTILVLAVTSCPSAIGYFPNPADRIPFSSTDVNVSTTQQPVWYTRAVGGSGNWTEVNSNTVSLSLDSELMARSSTETARVYYSSGRDRLASPVLPSSNSRPVSQTNPIRLIESNISTGEQDFTAIAIAPQQNPSDFVTITVRILENPASAPQSSPLPGRHNFPIDIILSTNSILPDNSASIPIYYTITYSTRIGDRASDPPDPTNATRYESPIRLEAEQNGQRVVEYRIRAVASHASYTNSEIIEFLYKNFQEPVSILIRE